MHNHDDLLEIVRRIENKVDDLTRLEILMIRLEKQMAVKFQDIVDEVASMDSAEDSLVAAFVALQQQLADAPTEAAKQAVMDKLESQKKKLLDAILANTPVEPPAA